MNKRELALLEKAFSAEIDSAFNKGGIHLLQTKAKKLAEKLVNEGYLEKRTLQRKAGVLTMTITGYELTHLGRLTYCVSCPSTEQ